MESAELAKKMLEWGELKAQLDALEGEIKQAVLEAGKTQTVGNVRATYSNPRKTYEDWEHAVMSAEPDGFDAEGFMVTPEPYVDWPSAAKTYGIERKSWVDENAQPSVSVKML